MSNNMSVINVNVPTEVKEEASNLFNSLGLNMSTAINIFLKKSIYEKGIPFDVSLKPTKELSEAIEELKYIESHLDEYKKYNDVDKMFDEILKDNND